MALADLRTAEVRLMDLLALLLWLGSAGLLLWDQINGGRFGAFTIWGLFLGMLALAATATAVLVWAVRTLVYHVNATSIRDAVSGSSRPLR